MAGVSLIGIVIALYCFGVFLALIFRGRLLKTIGTISAFISIPFFLILLLLGGTGGSGSGYEGLGLAFLFVMVGPIALPALGFTSCWIAKGIIKVEEKPLSVWKYTGIAGAIFVPILLFLTLVFRSTSYGDNYINKSSGYSVRLGKEALHLPIHSSIESRFSNNKSWWVYVGQTQRRDIKKLKKLTRKGHGQLISLKIRGLKHTYTKPISNVSPSHSLQKECEVVTNQNAKKCNFKFNNVSRVPKGCEIEKYQNSKRCKFIEPKFTMTFSNPSLSRHSKRNENLRVIRTYNDFDVVEEKWSEPKADNIEPKLRSITYRARKPKDLDSREILPIINCNTGRDNYRCSTRYYITKTVKVSYSFTTSETDVSQTFQDTRIIASDYWNMLLETNGE